MNPDTKVLLNPHMHLEGINGSALLWITATEVTDNPRLGTITQEPTILFPRTPLYLISQMEELRNRLEQVLTAFPELREEAWDILLAVRARTISLVPQPQKALTCGN